MNDTFYKPTQPETRGGRNLRRGDSFDIEDARTTHRLRIGQSILRSLGVESTWTHSKGHEERRGAPYGYNGCDDYCKVEWPEWATGRMFDLAYQLADELQTERGAFNRNQAYAAKAAAGR